MEKQVGTIFANIRSQGTFEFSSFHGKLKKLPVCYMNQTPIQDILYSFMMLVIFFLFCK